MNDNNAGRAQAAVGESGESSKSHDGLHVQPRRPGGGRFRPTVPEQAVRALLHMCQFAVAYFVMLYAILIPHVLLIYSRHSHVVQRLRTGGLFE